MRLEPSWRQPAGIALILAWIVLWCVLVATAAALVHDLPWPVQLLYYLVAGIAWIFPVKPLVRWMQTGRWRA